jgi:hypothetical protein
MPREDLLRPVQLFEQHAAHEQMRPGHRPQRERRVGALDDGAPETVGAADREGDGDVAGIAPARQAVRQFDAAPRRAALVEGNQPRTPRQRGEDQLGFPRFQFAGGQTPFFVDLDNRRRRLDAPGIERLKPVERLAAQPPDS